MSPVLFSIAKAVSPPSEPKIKNSGAYSSTLYSLFSCTTSVRAHKRIYFSSVLISAPFVSLKKPINPLGKLKSTCFKKVSISSLVGAVLRQWATCWEKTNRPTCLKTLLCSNGFRISQHSPKRKRNAC